MSNEMYNVLSRATDGLYEGALYSAGHLHVVGGTCRSCLMCAQQWALGGAWTGLSATDTTGCSWQ